MTDSADNAPLAIGKLPSALLGALLTANQVDDASVLVGPGVGRDAAAIRFGDAVLVAKSDPITFASTGTAAYLVDINANDLACLGATPRWLLVTALLHEGVTAADVETLFTDLSAVCATRGIAMVGGHTEITAGLDRTILVGTLLGETTEQRLLRPGGARACDDLLLSKGIAIEGTALLARERGDLLRSLIDAATVERAADLLDTPGISVVADAEAVLGQDGVRALHDPTEGGLAMAVRELATASGGGAIIERSAVPLLPETIAVASALALDPLGMLASGSLLIATAPETTQGLIERASRAGVTLRHIGCLTDRAGTFTMRQSGESSELPRFDTDEVSRALNRPLASFIHRSNVSVAPGEETPA